MNQQVQQEIDSLLNTPYTDLVLQFASEPTIRAAESQPNARFATPEEASGLFRRFLEKNSDVLQQAICPTWKDLRKDGAHQEELQIVAGIFDIVVGIKFGVSPVLLSVLLFRYGVDRFCGYYDTTSKETA